MSGFDWTDGGSGILSVSGVNLEYACWGPAPDQAPTLILLHEGLGCVALWREFPAKLAQATGLGVFAYSRKGYGKSDPVTLPRPLDFMAREAQEVVGPLLDAIGLRRGVLLGHSDGATIAAQYGGGVQDHRVRGLVLMAPHFFTEPGGLAEIAQVRDVYAQGDLKAKMGRYHDDPEGAFRGWNDVWLDPGFKAWNVADVIDYFRVPVLAIQGHGDQYGTMAQIDVIEERSYAPVELLKLDDCGHAPHLEQSEQVLAAIADFVARLVRIEAAEVVPA